MQFIITIASLCFLMAVAYRGHSVILFAPVAALGAVLLTDPTLVAPMFSGVFMDKMVVFVKNYFPVFVLSALFGKLVELSGVSTSIVAWITRWIGAHRAMLAIVLVSAVLTYGGVSVYVVVFAVYPFAAEMFRTANIPKRLIPGTIALGAFTFTMDALPGSPQIQNIIPTTFFMTSTWAAPWLGTIGGVFILVCGMWYLEGRRRQAEGDGEGYGSGHRNEPAASSRTELRHPLLALTPLFIVVASNKVLANVISTVYDKTVTVQLAGMPKPVIVDAPSLVAVWSVEVALLLGIASVLLLGWSKVRPRFAEGSQSAITGALVAAINTASEYGFGAVIAALPGFVIASKALQGISNPLVNEAVTVTALAGITGSASGGLGIALASMADAFTLHAKAAGIPMDVLHRVASMASGGMDTLPHNGAVITLLMVTGLTHRQSYRDIFAITCLKTLGVFVVIGVYALTGVV